MKKICRICNKRIWFWEKYLVRNYKYYHKVDCHISDFDNRNDYAV